LILREVQHCLRDIDYCFSLLTLDIDHFKKINDTHGHNIGDEVLKHVAKVLRNEEGIRYGGEEFYVVLSGQSENAAYTVAERIRDSIAAIKYQSANKMDNSLTISIGIADLSKALIPKGEDNQFTIQQLKKRADDALYLAKQARNCCKKHSECRQL